MTLKRLLVSLDNLTEFMENNDTSRILKEKDTIQEGLAREANLYSNLNTLKEHFERKYHEQ